MSRTNEVLNRAFGEAEAAVDWILNQVSGRERDGIYHIQPYRGHGTSDEIYISGRVYHGSPIPSAHENDATVRNLWHTTRRLSSDEVPAAKVRISAGDQSVEVLADDEGFFETMIPLDTHTPGGEVWRQSTIELIDPLPAGPPVTATGFSIVPPPEASFGIISDIDDTVVKTEVANVFRMMRLVLLTNAHTRLPFAGVAAFYRALHAGAAGETTNPIFYVSSSPWNFYDLLMEVFHVHEIPAGPLFLKDYGLARDLLLSRGHIEHKVGMIEKIMGTHPDLDFVLVGDSGQKDPEVYREVVRRHPDRVRVIYIRDVSPDLRDEEVNKLAEEVARQGIDLLLVEDTVTAAEHAASIGLIDPSALPEVRGEKAEDEAQPGPIVGAMKKNRAS